MAMNKELRKTYLGGTDLVAISGLSKHHHPGDVWLEKVKGSTFEGNAATEAGQDLEPVVTLRYQRRAEKRGEIVSLAELSDPIFDPEYPFIAANPDRIFTNRKRVFEAKTAAEDQLYKKDCEWGEDLQLNAIPIYYFGQVNHYIGAMKFDDGALSCFFLGKNRIQRDYPIEFDRVLYNMLRINGVTFWNTYIGPKIQPPLELFSPEKVMDAISDSAHAHGGKAGIVVEADPLLTKWAQEYKDLSDRMSALEGPKKVLAGKIAMWIAGKNGTKVIHPMGSFTYQKPASPLPVTVFNAEEAWKDLTRSLVGKLPPTVFDQILALTAEIQAKYTSQETPEPSKPKLHPYWK
jgi:predicted phage-related endonuclease